MATTLSSSSSSRRLREDGVDDGGDLASKCDEAVSRLVQLKINFLAVDFDLTVISIHTGGRWQGTSDDLSTMVRPVFKQLLRSVRRTSQVAAAPTAAGQRGGGGQGQGGIHVAVVTYTPQTKLVREVLELTLNDDDTHHSSNSNGNGGGNGGAGGKSEGSSSSSSSWASSIPIRGRDNSWKYDGPGSHKGKQPHMASAAEELMTKAPPSAASSAASGAASCDGGGGAGSAGGSASGGLHIRKDTTLLIDDDPNNVRAALADGVRAIWFNPDAPEEKLLEDLLSLR